MTQRAKRLTVSLTKLPGQSSLLDVMETLQMPEHREKIKTIPTLKEVHKGEKQLYTPESHMILINCFIMTLDFDEV